MQTDMSFLVVKMLQLSFNWGGFTFSIHQSLIQTCLQTCNPKLTRKTQKYVRTLNWDAHGEGEKM